MWVGVPECVLLKTALIIVGDGRYQNPQQLKFYSYGRSRTCGVSGEGLPSSGYLRTRHMAEHRS